MAYYDIWAEGFAATGQSGTAQLVVSGIEATSFVEACNKYFLHPYFGEKRQEGWGKYSCKYGRPSVWVDLFATEAEARKSFG